MSVSPVYGTKSPSSRNLRQRKKRVVGILRKDVEKAYSEVC